MHCYTKAELADIHFMYGAAQGNGLAAQRVYREQFPARELPDSRTFERLHREISASGSFYASRRYTGVGRFRRITAVEERILNTVGDNPSSSSRAAGRTLGVSHAAVLRLHEDRIHHYHLQRVQAMNLDEYFPCLNFAHWYLQQSAGNQTFPADGFIH
ncbi:uncharacterized protein LOC118190234 [Stegodyphus dumicola]|uniref:uncharacterized protein LOC118190234 n=1 Tax=Stegodyphus dumicola TaxID=202533 RepID=UPI0015AE990B|nr:uncharacterized protein LOC118190234 [Stegodyphus dumicola]